MLFLQYSLYILSSDLNFRLLQLKYKSSITSLFSRLKVSKYLKSRKHIFFSFRNDTSFLNILLIFILSKELFLKFKIFNFMSSSNYLRLDTFEKNIFNSCYQYITNLFFLPILESSSYRLSFGFRPYRNCFDFSLFIKKELLRMSFNPSFVLTIDFPQVFFNKEKLRNFFVNKNLGIYLSSLAFYNLENLDYNIFSTRYTFPSICTSIINFFASELFFAFNLVFY